MRQNPADAVGQKLTERRMTVAVAESCTGGLIAKLLTDIPGASGYFTCGWVTYSDKAKVTELGVDKALIDRRGAVSGEVAVSMARGARKRSGADFAVAVTGIAGPGGGTREKPVGLVYIAVAGKGRCGAKRFVFSGNRDLIRLKAAETAMDLLIKRLPV
jgi:nicotinamide-nucleotide amidase